MMQGQNRQNDFCCCNDMVAMVTMNLFKLLALNVRLVRNPCSGGFSEGMADQVGGGQGRIQEGPNHQDTRTPSGTPKHFIKRGKRAF